MRYLIGLFCLLLMFSCSEEKTNSGPTIADSTAAVNGTPPAIADPGATSQNPGATAATPQPNAANVGAHFYCPQNCSGGVGEAAGPCPVCQTAMVHNSAFHDQQTQDPSLTTGALSQTDEKPPEPAQNSSGVWHYTCAKGCAGGAGSAVPCGSCGATLVHNQGYH